MQASERESPQAVFATAQAAIARGDWEAFFACLDQTELLRIAKNGVGFLAASPPEPATQALCATHGFPLAAVRARGQRIVDSANAMRGPSTREQSLRHKDLVDEYTDGIEKGLKTLPDLAAFTAGVERWMRSGGGGGSVSSRLLVDETLHELVVEGKKARGKRRLAGASVEDIAFVQKRDGWRIRLPFRRV